MIIHLLLFSLHMAFEYFRNPGLEFVAAPALRPAEVEIDPAQMAMYEAELAQAAAAPLPDEVSVITSTIFTAATMQRENLSVVYLLTMHSLGFTTGRRRSLGNCYLDGTHESTNE